jgi:hypothetical protein
LEYKLTWQNVKNRNRDRKIPKLPGKERGRKAAPARKR